MSFRVIETTLAAAIATSGTLTLSYPAGTSRGNFFHGTRHRCHVVGAVYEAPRDFTLTFNASNITFTWVRATTLPVGAVLLVELDSFGASFPQGYDDGVVTLSPRCIMMETVMCDFGTPLASSATSLRAAAAVSGAGALTLLTAGLVFDVPRNVIITSVGNDSGITFAVVGVDEYGVTVAETITGANAGVAAGLKAFARIVSITASGASAGNVSIGFGNVLGFPTFVRSAGYIEAELLNAAAATAGTLVAGVTTTPSATTGDVRGTYVPNSAPDGTRAFMVAVRTDNPRYRGAPQFGG